MKTGLDTKTFLAAVARYGLAAETYLRNQGFGEKVIVAAGFREQSRGLVGHKRSHHVKGWNLTPSGWDELRFLYKVR